MAEIRHLVVIDAPVGRVYKAVTEQPGIAGWWTPQSVLEPIVGSIAEFNFGDRYRNRMRVTKLVENQRAQWECLEGDQEWVGTTYDFELEPRDDQTLLRFTHGGWRAVTDFFAHCNYNWGYYIHSLKRYCETGVGHPWEEVSS
jgi:uncharacterized protein YndB with AHSA1/START domain